MIFKHNTVPGCIIQPKKITQKDVEPKNPWLNADHGAGCVIVTIWLPMELSDWHLVTIAKTGAFSLLRFSQMHHKSQDNMAFTAFYK